MASRRLTIYGNWSAYDELSDGVPLTEELAMSQMQALLRLRSHGVRFDAYLMDAFWFDPDGGYRSWRKPNWPDGPQRWLDACAENNLLPGLWFTANTLCNLKVADAWRDSADANDWGLCCFHGGFLADFLDLLDDWYRHGIRIFKLDFADFTAAPPDIKANLSLDEIRARNTEALRSGLIEFQSAHPEAIFMAFNGFESREYMDRTDRPLEKVIDLAWLDVFDSIYSGDPRPADVPTIPFWRSVDIYGDHTTRVLEFSGVPLERIDNCGFMAGPTGTCYWRGKAMWKGMLLLTLARGGNLTVLYGDLSQFDEADAKWMAQAQSLFASAFAAGNAESFGGIPGEAEPYGWVVGSAPCVILNPRSSSSLIGLPEGNWKVLFADAGFSPDINENVIELAPFQMVLLGFEGPDLGVQEDCACISMNSVEYTILEKTERSLIIETPPGSKQVIIRQLDGIGSLVRTFAGPDSAAKALSITARQGGILLEQTLHHDRIIWSGMSWAAADIAADGEINVRIHVESTDPHVVGFDLEVLTLGAVEVQGPL